MDEICQEVTNKLKKSHHEIIIYSRWKETTQPAFSCSKLTIETLE